MEIPEAPEAVESNVGEEGINMCFWDRHNVYVRFPGI